MELDKWANRWNLPQQALIELRMLCGIVNVAKEIDARSEAGIQSLIRLEASQKGCRLWRNNVGATYTKDGAFLRYGLANESSNINKQIKSADLIGIRAVVITRAMIGLTIGQFISREVKSSDWKYSGTEREIAQLNWATLILSLGGDACFTTGIGTL